MRTFSRHTGLEADISLSPSLEEEVFFDMDTAVPIGMIVNELVSNSFKHAFPGGKKEKFKLNSLGKKTENLKTTELNSKIKSAKVPVIL